MNRKEKDALCALIAQWEWTQNGSASEASAYGRCAAALIQEFKPSDFDLNFARSWELSGIMNKHSDDVFNDLLFDLYEEKGNTWICDQVEALGFEGLARLVME